MPGSGPGLVGILNSEFPAAIFLYYYVVNVSPSMPNLPSPNVVSTDAVFVFNLI